MKLTRIALAAAIVLASLHLPPAPAQAAQSEATPGARLPMRFEPNLGQFPATVRYLARTPKGAVAVEDAALVFRHGGAAVRMAFEGAAPAARSVPLAPLPGVSNYLLGTDPSGWRTNVPGYAGVRSEGLYDGIDLAIYEREGEIEYDLIVAPGADPAAIRLTFDGARSIVLDDDGALVVETSAGVVRHRAPVIYQQDGGERRLVAGRYEMHGDAVGFALEEYDRSAPLVVDPVVQFATIFGGTGEDVMTDVAVTSDGGVVVAGWTRSYDIPLESPLYTDPNESSVDAFVARLDPTGTSLVFSTYFGGRSGDDQIDAVVLDGLDNVYVAGTTRSNDLPLVAPVKQTLTGFVDGFFAKLAADGSRLVYSTYVGGSKVDTCTALAVDEVGRLTVVGGTESPDFPRVGAVSLPRRGGTEVFVVQMAPGGGALTFATAFGGFNDETATAVALSGARIVVGGETDSYDFPTARAFQSARVGGREAFVTAVEPGQRAPIFSTYLGGDSGETVRGVLVDADGNVVVAGTTESPDFPVVAGMRGDADSIYGDAFVTKLNRSGTVLFSTYFGSATYHDVLTDAALAEDGSIYLSGFTQSLDFPEVDPLQPKPADGYYGPEFLSRLSANGDRVLFSTYVTGRSTALGKLAVDGSGNVWILGYLVGPESAAPRNPFGLSIFHDNPVVSRLVLSSTAIGLDVPEVGAAATGALVVVPVTVSNDGPGRAGDVAIRVRTAGNGRVVFARDALGVLPAEGPSGEEIVRIGAIAPGGQVTVELGVLVTAAAGESFDLRARVTTTAWLDGAQPPSAVRRIAVTDQPAQPPTVTSVKASGADAAFRIRVKGSGFAPGATVYVGADRDTWAPVKQKGTTSLVLKGGAALAAKLPPGVAVPIRIVNPDGGESTVFVSR